MALERWEIDSRNSSIRFSVRHMGIAKVRGGFSRWIATLSAEDGDLRRASLEAVIDAASIDTGAAQRDAHLESEDFLDAARYPRITFRGTVVETLPSGRLHVTGDLTMRAATRAIVLEVEEHGRTTDAWGNPRVGFVARTALDRRDFGLTWNRVFRPGGIMVSDRVAVVIAVDAVKQIDASAKRLAYRWRAA